LSYLNGLNYNVAIVKSIIYTIIRLTYKEFDKFGLYIFEKQLHMQWIELNKLHT